MYTEGCDSMQCIRLFSLLPPSSTSFLSTLNAMASAMDSRSRAEEYLRIAGEKFLQGDSIRARNYADKAESACPSLPGLASAQAAYRVHCKAEWWPLGDGSMNHYAILDVRPAEGLAAAKKKFKRMCLLTHPDKNKCPAAESAFLLVVKAWDVIQTWATADGALPRQSELLRPRNPPPSDHQSETSKPSAPPPSDHQSGTAKPRRRAPRRSRYNAEVRSRTVEAGGGQLLETAIFCGV